MTDQPIVTKEEWIAALRSDKYPQAVGGLRIINADLSVKGFCCLGVYCEVAGYRRVDPLSGSFGAYIMPNGEVETVSIPAEILKELLGQENIYDKVNALIGMNDTKKKSFSEIADYLESLP